MRLPDPRLTRAVLIGVGDYARLGPRPAARTGVVDLASVLTRPDCGGQLSSHCVVLDEAADSEQVADRLAEAASVAEDLLLFYFAGHGLLGPDGELYLALRGTSEQRPGPTGGLRYNDVRHIVRYESRAKNKIIILDCCYSGRALGETLSGREGAVTARTAIEGSAVLTAVPANDLAMILPGETYPAFTGRLIKILSDGIPGGPELLDLNTLHENLRMEIGAVGLRLPQAGYRNTIGHLALARNPAYAPATPQPAPALPRSDHEEIRLLRAKLAETTALLGQFQAKAASPVFRSSRAKSQDELDALVRNSSTSDGHQRQVYKVVTDRALASPGLNSDFPWDTFDSTTYYAHNYQSVRSDDREIVRRIRDFFASSSVPKDAHGIDVGTGTNLYPALAMLPFASEIELNEFSASNIAWLSSQRDAGWPSWDNGLSKFWDIYAEHEAYQKLDADPRLLLSIRTRLVNGSIFDLVRSPADRFDLGTMLFVAESLSKDPNEFELAVRRFLEVLKPGASFAAAFMEASEGYQVGDQFFPSASVGIDDIRASMEHMTTGVELSAIDCGELLLRPGSPRMILAVGQTKGLGS